jgi:hypothetical protein
MKPALTLLLFMLLNQVQAADFLFEIPVRLDLIPRGIPQAKIECDVYSKLDRKQVVASGYSIRAIRSSRGELNEIVEVHSNYLPDWRDSAVGSYQCRLLLLTPWAKPSWQTPSVDTGLSALQPRNNSVAITTVSGKIP